MDVQIFQYKESQLEEIRIILNDFLSFIANELSKPPRIFNLDVDHEVDFTMNNLDKFAEPDGRLLLVEVDGQIAGTISLREIREYSGEIKRMYVRLKFRGEKLGNLMIEEVIRVSKETVLLHFPIPPPLLLKMESPWRYSSQALMFFVCLL